MLSEVTWHLFLFLTYILLKKVNKFINKCFKLHIFFISIQNFQFRQYVHSDDVSRPKNKNLKYQKLKWGKYRFGCLVTFFGAG